MKYQVIVVLGPTASGKTDLSIQIAKKTGGEIISADSMQIYKEMNIGTAKPTQDEMQEIAHYMIGEVSISFPYSVALYQKKAFSYINDIVSRGKTPVVVGGTGLYINSLLYKLDFTATIRDENFRNELELLSGEELHKKLKILDETSSLRIHPNDKKRLIRRLEIIKSGGDADYNFREKNTDYDFCCIGITMERKQLYKRINERVDKMVQNGLIKEVENIYKKFPESLIALKAIGYKEIIEYIENRCSLDQAIEEIKKNTRRFAKRQLTWFNNDERITWFSYDDYATPDRLAEAVMEYISQ